MKEPEEAILDVEMRLAVQDVAICEIGIMEVVHTPPPGPICVAELDGRDMDVVHTSFLGPNDTNMRGCKYGTHEFWGWNY